MTPDQANAAADNLVAAVNTSAVSGGQGNETAAGQLAPGLAFGSNIPGGYNYQRFIAPLVPAITAPIVSQTKQALLKRALQDASNNANVTLADAQFAYQQRQRAYQRKKAIEAAQQAAEAKRQRDAYYASLAASSAAAAASGGGGAGPAIVSKSAPGATPQTGLQATIPGSSLQGSNPNLQGGAVNLQGGNSGLSLNTTSGKNIKLSVR